MDPKLNWISESHGGADKLTVIERGPGVEEFVEIGGSNSTPRPPAARTG